MFNYIVMNSGHDDNNEVREILNAGCDELSAVAAGSGSPWGLVAAGALQLGKLIGSILDANCDGIVAADKIAHNRATLDTWTSTNNGVYTQEIYYPGTDSEDGCGSNSEYFVTWTIVRL